jgi:hypothetical protein
LTLAAAILGLAVCTAALAQERKVYKYVDEKGNVVYSQTPPLDASKARKIDATPAYSGRGGNSSPVSPYGSPRVYRGTGQQSYGDPARERQEQEEARKNRLAELEAECNRNRGTDCKNPATLRYLESTQIPRESPPIPRRSQ